MKRTACLLVLLTASFFGPLDPSNPHPFGMNVALAKPPPWAPAYGYRRKHHEEGWRHDRDDDDHDHDWDREGRRRILEEPLRQVIVVSRYEEIFRRLDVNRDGRISRSEWVEDIALFDRLDRNHDGVLTRDEYDHIEEQRGFLTNILYKIKNKVASLWDKLW